VSSKISFQPSTPEWNGVRRRVAQEAWAAEIVDAVVADAEYWRPLLQIPQPGPDSAWSHHYFCDDDGEKLTFDPQRPRKHVCPACGRAYDEEVKHGAWRTIMHNAVAAQAQRDALIIRLVDDPERTAAAVEELQSIIEHYGRHYLDYPEHGVNVGTGRVLPQNLDESIWTIGLLRSVRWAEDVLSEQTVQAAGRLARGASELLRPQVGMIHNIHCWILASLAECAVRLGDSELLTFTTDSEFGVKAQLEQGFRPEGLWWEINPHYHYYTVQALLCWSEAAGADLITEAMAESLERAVSAPAELAYSDGLMPAYGDGWPSARLSTFTSQAEGATRLIPGNTIDLAPFYAVPRQEPVQLWGGASSPTGDSSPLAGRSSVAALIFGPDRVPGRTAAGTRSFSWPGCGIAVLRGHGTRIALRSGPDAGWHDHHDKLAVDIETASGWRSLDLGTSGYGADFTRWMRSPAAHSTVFVGNQAQPPCDGAIAEFAEDHVVGTATWPGCRLSRRIELVPDGWIDTVEVDLDEEQPIEWVMHGDGLLSTRDAGTPTELDDVLGHQFLRDPRKINISGDQLVFGWDLDVAPTVEVRLPAGFSAYAAEGEGNPSGHPLGTMMISGVARQAVITARFVEPGPTA
jgi:hypothetical protein